MFNFEELDIQKNTNDIKNSFVGIRKSSETDRMTFYLPKGFDDFEVSYDSIKKMFFSMYKTFKKFEIDNFHNFDKMLDKEGKNRDNTNSRHSKGYSFSDDETVNEILLYSKIDIIDDFFKIHKELDIDSIVQRFGSTDNIDYSNIEFLLNEGVFLENDAIFISDNTSEKNVIESSISELAEIYCYIYKELSIELDNCVSPMISEVANNFSYKYLTSLQSLFNKDNYDLTILILKDCLDVIDKRTAYKDYLYYNIYEVIEQFLYGQLSVDDDNGSFWGINNFSYIWEDMCNSYMLTSSSRKILYCDSSLESEYFYSTHDNLIRRNSGGHLVYTDKEFINNFHIEMNGHKRWIRPDIILINKNYNRNLNHLISKDLISLDIENLNHKLLGNIGKVNISLKLKEKNIDGNEDSLYAEHVFKYFKNEFSGLKSTTHSLYHKAKGHQFIEITEKFIKLKNISKEVFDGMRSKKDMEGEDDNIYIIDWKYVPSVFFKKISEKLNVDIIKQLTYEFCIAQNESNETEFVSQFCIPKHCTSNRLVIGQSQLPMSESNIQIISLNFNFLQREYISRETSLS